MEGVPYFDKTYVTSRHEYVRELRELAEKGAPEPQEDWDSIYVFSGPELTLDPTERPKKHENNPYNQTLTRLEEGFDLAKKITLLRLNRLGIEKNPANVTTDDIKTHGPSVYFDGYQTHNQVLKEKIGQKWLSKTYGFPDEKFAIAGPGTEHTGDQVRTLPREMIDSSRKIVFVSDLYHLPRIERYIGSKYDPGIPIEKIVLYPHQQSRVTVKQGLAEARKLYPYELKGELRASAGTVSPETILPAERNDALESLDMHANCILDKGVGLQNEDAILAGERVFAVFDGISSLNDYTDESGKTGGYLAAHIAKDTFELSPGSIREKAIEANKKIAEAMAAKHINQNRRENVWGTTFAAVEIDPDRKTFEWAQVADALILVIYDNGTHHMLIEDDYDHDRNMLSEWKALSDRSIPDGRNALQDRLVELRKNANVSYGVLNGDPQAASFIRTGIGSLENVAHILIFTDGFMIPKKDPGMPDNFAEIATLYLQGGLSAVRNRIREIENADPECRLYPRYKKSDDIAAIALRFEQANSGRR